MKLKPKFLLAALPLSFLLTGSYAFAADNSLYIYEHRTPPNVLRGQLEQIQQNNIPRHLIYPIGGFGEDRTFNTYAANFERMREIFPIDTYQHIGSIEADQVQLGEEDANHAFEMLQLFPHYNRLNSFSLDCEPFFASQNNVEFHINLIQRLNTDYKSVSAYVNPGHLARLQDDNPDLLRSFLNQVTHREGNEILLPVYSYDNDRVNDRNIQHAINLLNEGNVPYQVILDTKQPERLGERFDFIKKNWDFSRSYHYIFFRK